MPIAARIRADAHHLAATLRVIWAGAACAAVLATCATAADLDPPATQFAPAGRSDRDAPVFFGTFYLWASGLSGTTSTLPPLPAANVDLSFGDVLKNFDGGLMGAVEMRAGRWSVIGDVMFTQVSPGTTMPGPFAADVSVRSRSLTVQGDVLYRLYASETFDIDAGAGLRFWNLDNRLTIGPGLAPAGIAHDVSQSWLDPILAGRVSARLGGPWSVVLLGDVGGFDLGARLTWQVIGTVNYQWNENLALRAGYRALSVDYQNGDFLYDVLMQGPILGATYRF
ncbi:hypothetical protein [Aquabacter spiritensis]|uniref:Outer membrane protein beta-barrel domain-containing protein n=1 Tax=Aquabacter spiritensis TaxID=933073 RepID=A0A4V2UX50_9HYPH|nr:hypothetical protein [Aquabacter spiritensis]TCT02198.1 hypothetical protein EDC64_11458 [Aquabacter spiritensis]